MSKQTKANTPFDRITRRTFVATVGAGAALSVMGIGPTRTGPAILRPPGTIEEAAFLSLCARCGRCVSVCPNSALQLQGLGKGLSNLMTPSIVPTRGYCIMPVNGCQNCIQACPAKVLQPLPIDGLASHELSRVLKMGTAVLDTSICIPHVLKQPCLACKEICPVEGAITTYGGEGSGRGAGVQNPLFHPDVCVGCGACEFACPTNPKAVTISSQGAKRTEWGG